MNTENNPITINNDKNFAAGPSHLFVSVGDISAEEHAVRVVKYLKKHQMFISSVGGEALKEVSDIFIGDTVSLETFGFTPSLTSLYGLYGVYKKVQKHFSLCNDGPLFLLNKDVVPPKISAVLLVDFYGFNSKIAVLAKKYGIPVFYYIPPQVWATRYNRIKKIKKYVDKVFLTLPFEKEIYRREGINYQYVGHPLTEKISLLTKGKNTNSVIKDSPVVGFFPGSRSDIIKRHIPILNAVAVALKNKTPQVTIRLFGLSSVKDAYKGVSYQNIEVIFDDAGELRKDIDCALSVSGTIATELALMRIPTVIFYKVSALNAFILRSIINVKYVALPNIVLGQEVFPEYLQDNSMNISDIADYLALLIKDDKHRSQILAKLDNFRRQLEPENKGVSGNLPVSQQVADSIIEYLSHKKL